MTEAANKIAIIEPNAVSAPPASDVRPFDPMALLDKAVSGGAPLDMIDRLVSLGERMQAMKARQAFDAAIAAAKAEIKPVARNASGHNNKRYADFSAYAKAIDPILSRHGLSYRFRSAQAERITVTCVLSHRDGYSEENSLTGPADTSGSKNAIQAIGSTLTYLQRYTLVQALGLAAGDDDDGRASGGDAAPDAPLVSEAQVAAITKAIGFKGRTVEALCKRLGVESLADIYADKFSDVLAMIGNLSDAPTKEVGHD